GGTGGTGCQPKSGDATALPRAAYLLLDRSASMADSQKLNTAIAGINAFATGSNASGIELGLQYFGLDTGGTCAGGGYGTPAVGFGLLPALAQSVASWLAAITPNGATPFEGALNGAKLAGTAYLSSKPGRQLDVVILTDISQITGGGGCTSNSSLFASIVGSTWPAMATHFVALPASTKSMLDSLASAGGTVTAVSASSQLGVTAALNQAITPCRFAIPSGHTAAQLSLTLGGQKLTRHSTPSSCSFSDGWFEHAGAAVLCGSTCQDLSMGGKVTFTASCG
ncbi:MAG: hypothetical protein HYZ29_37110, partial [Myxococcales bacterium]|nr:hypothetical protein [Myxococcales bacterium]